MNKNLTIIALAVIVVGSAYLMSQWQGKPYIEQMGEKRSLFVANDLTPVSLTPEERKAAEKEGIEFLPNDDPEAENIKIVRNSDEVLDIESDIDETDLSDIDAEADVINGDLSSY